MDLIPPQIMSKRDLIRSAIFLDAVCPLNGFDNPPRLNPYFFNLQFFITFNCDKTFQIIFFFRSTCLTNWFIYLYVYFIRFLDSLNFTLSYFSCHTAVVWNQFETDLVKLSCHIPLFTHGFTTLQCFWRDSRDCNKLGKLAKNTEQCCKRMSKLEVTTRLFRLFYFIWISFSFQRNRETSLAHHSTAESIFRHLRSRKRRRRNDR